MLSEDEISAFHSLIARPESLDAQAGLAEKSLPYRFAYGIVLSAARSGSLSSNGLRDSGEPELGPDRVGAFVVEGILFYLHMLDRLAFRDAPLQHRCTFMDELVQGVVEILWRSCASEIELGRFVKYLTTLYNARQEEYAGYGPPPPEGDASQKNTLLWEYGKRMSSLISPRKSAMRVVLIGNIAMKYVAGLVPLVHEAAVGQSEESS